METICVNSVILSILTVATVAYFAANILITIKALMNPVSNGIWDRFLLPFCLVFVGVVFLTILILE